MSVASLASFALICLAMVLTPGPNMVYVISRSVTQGPMAGIVSVGGVAVGLTVYMLCAVFGITTLLIALPYAYDALRFCGAAYLLWLAWITVRPGGTSPLEVRTLPPDRPRRLFVMGLLTSLLNPKVAVLYLSLMPQFIDPTAGPVLAQSLTLGLIQIAISIGGNCLIALAAGSIATFLAARPFWSRVQRYLMGAVLGGFAVRMATEAGR